MVYVTSTMIMNFKHYYTKYGGNHKFCRHMVSAVQNAGIAHGNHDAVIKLQLWSTTLKEKFTRANGTSEGITAGIIRRRGIGDQLEKMNQNVLKVLDMKAQMQASLVEHTQQLHSLKLQLDSLQTVVQSIGEQKSEVLTGIRLVIVQNQQFMSRMGVEGQPGPITEGAINALIGTPVTTAWLPQNPPVAGGTPVGALPGAMPGAINAVHTPGTVITPITVATQGAGRVAVPTPRAVATPRAVVTPRATVNNTLMRHTVANTSTGTKGISVSSESLPNILKELYYAPRDVICNDLRGGGRYLHDHTTHVHTKICGAKQKARPRIHRVLQLLDALWTKEERNQYVNKTLGDLDAHSLFARLARKCVVAVHVPRKDQKRATPTR